MTARELLLDISARIGEPATIAASYFPAQGWSTGRPVLMCLPGGTYTGKYFDLDVPGYSFAEFAAARGFPVVTVDHFGTGRSSRPDRDITLADQAAALAAAMQELRTALHLPGPYVAVGHSMGGYVAIVQQATYRSYAAVAILGTTNSYVEPLGLPPETISAAATAEGRAMLVEQMLGVIPDLYVTGDRAPMRSWFHLSDVPDALVQADDASTLTVVPRHCAAESSVPGVTAKAAAEIDVPVFLGYGEVDVSPAPRAEPAFYRACPDVTLYVLAGSGHCHNMAGSRGMLWERLAQWLGTDFDSSNSPGLRGMPAGS